jgi:hypothetical protein
LDEFALKLAGEADASLDQFKNSVNSSKDAVLQFLFPLQTNLLTALSEKLAANRAQFVALGDAIATRVRPIIDGLIAKLSGDFNVEGAISKFNSVVTAAESFANAVSTGINSVVIPAFNALVAAASVVAETINGLFGTQLTGGALLVVAALLKVTGTFGLVSAAIQVLVATVGALVAAFGAVPVIIGVVAAAFLLWLTNAAGGLDGLQQKFTAVWTAVTSGAQSAIDGIKGAFSAGLGAIGNFFVEMERKVVSIFESLIRKAKEFLGIAGESANAASGGGGDEPGFARGGYVRGPGTGTSDSIVARLSNGEFVHRLRAVKKYGLDFMNALNIGAVPEDAVRALMGGMTHGMAAAVAPGRTRFATGGLVDVGTSAGGGRPFTLQIGGESISGLTANDDAIDRLQRYASRKSVNSAGRKPTWYHG